MRKRSSTPGAAAPDQGELSPAAAALHGGCDPQTAAGCPATALPSRLPVRRRSVGFDFWVALGTTLCQTLYQLANELGVCLTRRCCRIIVEDTLMILVGVGHRFIRWNNAKKQRSQNTVR